MKTDNYLNLCLEQAALSPLRYRHGAITVRGGKVIGQGFNDYRPGFDGGALETGRLASQSLHGPAITELKKKRKLRRDLQEPVSESTKTFMPFESVSGGGHLVNTPFSMHSEMMAIHSALAASSTLASTAVSYQKPYFKLSGNSKRKSRLRRDAVKSYVQAVCSAAVTQSGTKPYDAQSQVQEWRFEGGASGSKTNQRVSRQQEARGYGTFFREQYDETPTKEEERESSSSQS